MLELCRMDHVVYLSCSLHPCVSTYTCDWIGGAPIYAQPPDLYKPASLVHVPLSLWSMVPCAGRFTPQLDLQSFLPVYMSKLEDGLARRAVDRLSLTLKNVVSMLDGGAERQCGGNGILHCRTLIRVWVTPQGCWNKQRLWEKSHIPSVAFSLGEYLAYTVLHYPS